MDLALAYAVAAGLPGGMEGLDSAQRVALGYACRAAKETLFADPKGVGPGHGARPGLEGHRRLDQDRADARDAQRRPRSTASSRVAPPTDSPERGRRVGLTEIGLPYAADPAVTRHLARFLNRQAGSLHAGDVGGAPVGRPVQRRRLQGPASCDRGSSRSSRLVGRQADVPALAATDLDLAVAHGAAYYGLVRRGKGIRIRGGVPRAYYVGIETSAPAVPGVAPPLKALCVVPIGMEEGTEADVPGPEFGLVVGEPAEFRFLGSTTRRDDRPGTVLERWAPEEIQELDPLETVLGASEGSTEGDTVPVRLHAHVTEVGTLDLWCQSTRGDGRWKLEYNVRENADD